MFHMFHPENWVDDTYGFEEVLKKYCVLTQLLCSEKIQCLALVFLEKKHLIVKHVTGMPTNCLDTQNPLLSLGLFLPPWD